ncbi:hypothetical protein AnigIFM60653_007544 [Aspergillus niger]|nr:hypothetical protein AnigIFM60653_007544 [Aspergillus niger]GLA39639.1 hypothetical protein AnigIFM63309_007237 [Aspergillus niger]
MELRVLITSGTPGLPRVRVALETATSTAELRAEKELIWTPYCARQAFIDDFCNIADMRVDIKCDDERGINIRDLNLDKRAVDGWKDESG